MPQYIVLAPVIALLALGLFITLQSGSVGDNSRGALRTIASNFSAMMIRIVCYLAGILMLQQILGSPSLLSLGR